MHFWSSLLFVGFLWLWQMGTTLCCMWASHSGFSCGASALGTQASVVVTLGSSFVAWIWLLHGMGDPLELGIKPMSPALADRLPTPGQPGESLNLLEILSVVLSPVFFFSFVADALMSYLGNHCQIQVSGDLLVYFLLRVL